MLLCENTFTEFARVGFFPYVSFIYMLLLENSFTEIAVGGVFP